MGFRCNVGFRRDILKEEKPDPTDLPQTKLSLSYIKGQIPLLSLLAVAIEV